MSNRFCTVCQNRSRLYVFGMQAAGHDVHGDVGRVVLLAVSLNVDDCP